MKHILLLMLFCSSLVSAQQAELSDIDIQKQANHWRITPHYELSLSEAIIKAIESGVEITFISECQLQQEIKWWPDRLLAGDKQSYEIHYFSLSNQYQLRGIDQDYMTSFLRLSDLLQQLGQKTTFKLPLNGAATITTCRFYLDQRALPSTMQLPILWDDKWSLDSKRQSRSLPLLNAS